MYIFAENDHPGGNSKVGLGDFFKKKKKNGEGSPRGDLPKSTTHTPHTHRSFHDVGSKQHLRETI